MIALLQRTGSRIAEQAGRNARRESSWWQASSSCATATAPSLSNRKAERALLRKFDCHILPFICAVYLITFLDRTNISNARTLNSDTPGSSLNEQIGLQGIRYSLVVAVFYIFYAAFELPSNFLLKYFTPSKWIGRILITWSIVAVCQAGATNYTGFLVARAALGLAEAGFFPGVIFYFTFWYRPEEQGFRLALFSASNALAGSFGGALATGISFLNGKGGLDGWQYLFIIEGAPGILLAFAIFLFLPDFPQTAKFLTEEERELAVNRLGKHAPTMTDPHVDWQELKRVLRQVDFWLFSLGLFLMTSSLTATSYFLPTLIADLGFKGWRSQLMTVPPNLFAFFAVVGNAMWSDHRRERISHTLLGLVILAIGYLLLAITTGFPARLTGVFLIACTNVAVIPFLALRTATIGGSTATAAATGFSIAFTNLNGIIAPFAFGTNGGLVVGNWTVFAFQVVAIAVVLILWHRLGASALARGIEEQGETVEKMEEVSRKDGIAMLDMANSLSQQQQQQYHHHQRLSRPTLSDQDRGVVPHIA